MFFTYITRSSIYLCKCLFLCKTNVYNDELFSTEQNSMYMYHFNITEDNKIMKVHLFSVGFWKFLFLKTSCKSTNVLLRHF